MVVVGGRQGGFDEATFADARGRATGGWLPAAALGPAPGATAAADWAGHWESPDSNVDIVRAAGGALHVTGDATWGGHDPERVRNGGVHTGELDFTARPVGDRLTSVADDDICHVRMHRAGPYLLVDDDGGCGGMNVTFSGIYRRAR